MNTTKEFKNNDLAKVVEVAKAKGYKVYTYENTSNHITQIFIENTNGQIGTAQAHYGGIKFSTIHRPERGSGNGSGFGSLVRGEEFNSPENIDICFIHSPYWTNGRQANVTKYKSFADYLKYNTILNYYEI